MIYSSFQFLTIEEMGQHKMQEIHNTGLRVKGFLF